MVDQSQVDAVSGVNGLEGESIAPGEVDAGGVLRVPAYSDNSNALQEAESIWYNDGSGPDPEGFYGFKGGAVVGPLSDVGVFEDTNGDGVAELQESHVDFGGGDVRNAGAVQATTSTVTQIATRARLSNNSLASVSSATVTKIPLEASQFEDVDAVDADLTNNRLTIKEDGKFVVNATVMWASSSGWATADQARVRIHVNGGLVTQNYNRKVGTGYEMAEHSRTLELTAGDTVSLQVYQTSGASQDVEGYSRPYTSIDVGRLG